MKMNRRTFCAQAGITLASLTALAQKSLTPSTESRPVPMPADRADDSYAIFSLLITVLQKTTKEYLILNATENPRSSTYNERPVAETKPPMTPIQRAMSGGGVLMNVSEDRMAQLLAALRRQAPPDRAPRLAPAGCRSRRGLGGPAAIRSRRYRPRPKCPAVRPRPTGSKVKRRRGDRETEQACRFRRSTASATPPETRRYSTPQCDRTFDAPEPRDRICRPGFLFGCVINSPAADSRLSPV